MPGTVIIFFAVIIIFLVLRPKRNLHIWIPFPTPTPRFALLSLWLSLFLTKPWGLEIEIKPSCIEKGFWKQACQQCFKEQPEGTLSAPRHLHLLLPSCLTPSGVVWTLPSVLRPPSFVPSVQWPLASSDCWELEMRFVWPEMCHNCRKEYYQISH